MRLNAGINQSTTKIGNFIAPIDLQKRSRGTQENAAIQTL